MVTLSNTFSFNTALTCLMQGRNQLIKDLISANKKII